MTLNEAKIEVDRTLASLFFDRMKSVNADDPNAGQVYKLAASETSELLMHMKDRLNILFGQDTEALAQFLLQAGIKP